MIKIRPHHLLCMQNYKGEGYDQVFTENMDRIVKSFKEDPDTEVLISAGCDELCSACPNRSEDACATEEKIRRLDRRTAKACALEPGAVIRFRDAAKAAEEKIFKTEKFAEICGECCWYELCAGIRGNKNR